MYLTITIMNMISFSLVWMNHPISLGIMIIIQTLNIAMMMGMIMGSFWFSYIIIIVMLSGMLVLFIYMASIASNEKFQTPIKLLMGLSMIMISSLLLQFMNPPFYMDFNKPQSVSNMEPVMLMNMMNNNKIIIMMVIYLFFSMAVISMIVNISEGPLRANK
uniref:NADH dehydrogenase subunit 6 n=1 Tax=Antilochus coquebertii TaxID=1577200 RepID=A0A4Y1JW24_9HEMI|nr:NADH dehydrogenase subunit 6 [Antilochus coquebertii]APO08972.1 NADH dehydrogenase subunit 6 [Antilochus coquebertii]